MQVYIKAAPKKIRKKPRKVLGISSVLFFAVGLFLIFQAIWPVMGWYLFVMPGFSEKIISPLATTFPPLVRAVETDSYQPNSWFSNTSKSLATVGTSLRSYKISIPKLKINNANVEIGGDLKTSLVAWPTSALPGTWGNNIIFGHSELPQFATPSNYSGIFTHLMELENGDSIFVDYDGVKYQYKVVDKNVIEPTDISVLEQRYDSSYVTLITCVPPGTIWKRGIIKAQITKI
ncbi:sortase [Candidatus Microgenomates bacterium]|nr:sortase [Candidatus Microgenomates bacterium]